MKHDINRTATKIKIGKQQLKARALSSHLVGDDQ